MISRRTIQLLSYVVLGTASVISPLYSQCSCEWLQDHKITANSPVAHASFGVSVSMDGNVLVVGAPGDDSIGKAYVYRHIGSSWQYEETLAPVGAQSDLHFAHSVAVSGGIIVIGAPYANNHAGVAYVYRFVGGQWLPDAQLASSTPADNEEFGWSVSVDGDAIAVGARFEDSAHVFRNTGGIWTHESVPADGQMGSTYGLSVSISGGVLFVGAPENDQASTNAGCVYIYRFDGTNWIRDPGQIFASDAASGSHFGHSVSVRGNMAVVGAYQPGTGPGSAYVLRFDGMSWNEEKLLASDGAIGHVFGWSVSAGDDIVVVGAHGAQGNKGRAYAFRWNDGLWTEHKMEADDGLFQDWLGYSVAVSGDEVIAGADGDDLGPLTDAGSAYSFHVSKASWKTYGDGVPGTHGVPMLTPLECPVLGRTLAIDVTNSLGIQTTGYLMFGFAEASIDTPFCGDLLVQVHAVFPLALPSAGVTLIGSVSNDPYFDDLDLYLQILEQDIGACGGVSFSPGLRLTLGY